jgi:thioredoxin reductase
VEAVCTTDRQTFPVNAVYHKPPYVQHSNIPETLGCEMNEQGLLKVDDLRQTSVKGVFACGDSAAFRSVATAVFTGSITGATINKILAEEDFNGH